MREHCSRSWLCGVHGWPQSLPVCNFAEEEEEEEGKEITWQQSVQLGLLKLFRQQENTSWTATSPPAAVPVVYVSVWRGYCQADARLGALPNQQRVVAGRQAGNQQGLRAWQTMRRLLLLLRVCCQDEEEEEKEEEAKRTGRLAAVLARRRHYKQSQKEDTTGRQGTN